MWVKIEDLNTSPRETLCWRFLNSGREPIHIERIEGDNGFTLGDHFDACTIPAGPEPVTDDCAVPHVKLLERKPTRIFAIDSMGKPWPLRKGDLNEVYKALAKFTKDQAFIQADHGMDGHRRCEDQLANRDVGDRGRPTARVAAFGFEQSSVATIWRACGERRMLAS